MSTIFNSIIIIHVCECFIKLQTQYSIVHVAWTSVPSGINRHGRGRGIWCMPKVQIWPMDLFMYIVLNYWLNERVVPPY